MILQTHPVDMDMFWHIGPVPQCQNTMHSLWVLESGVPEFLKNISENEFLKEATFWVPNPVNITWLEVIIAGSDRIRCDQRNIERVIMSLAAPKFRPYLI